MAAHLRRDSCSIEFLAREPVGFLDTKIRTGKVYKLLRPFRPVLDMALRTDEFVSRYPVEGEASFFTYDREAT